MTVTADDKGNIEIVGHKGSQYRLIQRDDGYHVIEGAADRATLKPGATLRVTSDSNEHVHIDVEEANKPGAGKGPRIKMDAEHNSITGPFVLARESTHSAQAVATPSQLISFHHEMKMISEGADTREPVINPHTHKQAINPRTHQPEFRTHHAPAHETLIIGSPDGFSQGADGSVSIRYHNKEAVPHTITAEKGSPGIDIINPREHEQGKATPTYVTINAPFEHQGRSGDLPNITSHDDFSNFRADTLNKIHNALSHPDPDMKKHNHLGIGRLEVPAGVKLITMPVPVPTKPAGAPEHVDYGTDLKPTAIPFVPGSTNSPSR